MNIKKDIIIFNIKKRILTHSGSRALTTNHIYLSGEQRRKGRNQDELILVLTVSHEFSESLPFSSGGTCINQRQRYVCNSLQFQNFLGLAAKIHSLFSIQNQLNEHKPKDSHRTESQLLRKPPK